MTAIESADVLIFTTPTYCMRASAPMKSFIDLTFNYWMVHRPRKCMFTKKAIVVSTAAGSGIKSAIKDITNTLLYWGVPYVLSYGISVQAMNWNAVADKKKEKIDKEVTIPGINPYSTWEDIYAGGSLDAYIRGRIGLGVLVGQGAGAGMVVGAQLKAGFKASLETDFLDDYTILDRQQFKAGPYLTFSGYVEGVANVGPYTFL